MNTYFISFQSLLCSKPELGRTEELCSFFEYSTARFWEVRLLQRNFKGRFAWISSLCFTISHSNVKGCLFFFIRMYITWNLIIINWVNYFKLMILNIVNLCQGFLNKVIGYKWGKNKLWYGDNHWRRGWRLHIDRGRRYFIWNWFGY